MSPMSNDINEPVTEIVRIWLRDGVGVGDLEGEGEYGRIWREASETVAKQDGCTNSYYGGVLEEEGVVVWCIDWTSLAQHKSFMDSPAYAVFLERLKPIMQNAEIIHLGRLHVESVVGKGVMEIGTFFDVEDVFVENTQKFITSIHTLDAEKRIKGFLGVIEYGEVIEKIAKDRDAKEEEKGRALVLMVGWESWEAHMAFRKTQEFADNIGLLRKGTSGAKMSHVAFKSAWS